MARGKNFSKEEWMDVKTFQRHGYPVYKIMAELNRSERTVRDAMRSKTYEEFKDVYCGAHSKKEQTPVVQEEPVVKQESHEQMEQQEIPEWWPLPSLMPYPKQATWEQNRMAHIERNTVYCRVSLCSMATMLLEICKSLGIDIDWKDPKNWLSED